MKKMIILDRDGILNKLLVNPITNEIDSPMSIKEVYVFDWAPNCLKQLNDLGFLLSVATNQPNFAKGRLSKETLQGIHDFILEKAQSSNAVINSSHICFHKKEDMCGCRKPKIGLLEQSYSINNFNKSKSWMVGDKHTDIMAGIAFGVNTTLLGNEEELNILKQYNLAPTYHGKDLRDFVGFLKLKAE